MEPGILLHVPHLGCVVIRTRGKQATRGIPLHCIHSILEGKTEIMESCMVQDRMQSVFLKEGKYVIWIEPLNKGHSRT